MKIFIKILIISVFFISCFEKGERSALLPNVTGKAGEVLLVIDEINNSGQVGSEIQKVLMAEHIGLPQPEPLFDIVPINELAFKDILKKYRNIMIITVKKSFDASLIKYKKDLWAKPQNVISLEAPNSADMVSLIATNSNDIIRFFVAGERDRIIEYNKSIQKREISAKLTATHKLNMIVPSGYLIKENKENFIWLEQNQNKGRINKHQITQGIFVYHYPYTDTSQLEFNWLIAKRDEVLMDNVPGPSNGSYMTTEKRVEPSFNVNKSLNNTYTVEIRGLWKTEGDFMGGPFISVTTVDTAQKRVVTAEGFVYAPQFDKRNYLRQVEAIIKTIKFVE